MAQRGFTLLELVLAFGLLVVVLGALALSVDLHLRVSQLGRQRVEEAQLARVILQRIADDIRGAVPPQTADFESLAKTLSSLLEGVETLPLSDAGLTESESQGQSGQQTSGGSSQQGTNRSSGSQSSGQMSTGSGGSMSTGSSGSGETSSESGESEEGEEETTETILGVPRSVPGLYGGPDWLQVDVSRIPRPDEYQAFWPTGITGSEGWELNRVSEMKTILYGLMIPGSTMSMSQTLVSTDAWGLYRDEVDRAAGALASEQNVLDQKVRSVGPLAPEVVWLEFWYFDGIQWYDSWDSEAQGGLPVAIEVIIGLDMSRSPAVANAAATELAGSEPVLNEPQTLYRTVIYLPVAQPTASQTASTEELSTGSETSEQSSSGSQ
ncbi:MAG: hypothetical protein NZ899_05200 [Thermoguttaceae bacterium]|nr:hypothetical protein [Thermoguttaceae bacterium]MDW8078287.1 hypothetical protein [Thermoguttaceae bacterium]